MDFDDQLARAKPGDEIVYHVGPFCAQPITGRRVPQAQLAWQAYMRGDVVLYQRRIKEGQTKYCAKVIR